LPWQEGRNTVPGKRRPTAFRAGIRVFATDTSKAMTKIPTIDEGIGYLADYGPPMTVVGAKRSS